MTDAKEREKGFYGALRPGITFAFYRSEELEFTLLESFYLKGYQARDHSFFENRVELAATMKFRQDKLSLNIPLIWQWVPEKPGQLWLNPEVIYSLSQSLGLGAAFYTANFLEPEQASAGYFLSQSVVQLVLQYSL